jgi:hypothetical protein
VNFGRRANREATPAGTPEAAAGTPGAPAGKPGAAADAGQAWSPPWWRVGAYTATGLAGAALAAVGQRAGRIGSLDAPGRILIAIIAAGLLGLAARDALARPTLQVSFGGLSVFDGLRRRHLPWAAVQQVQATTLTHNRRGVHVRILEISTIDGPVLLSRRQLGADPATVAAAVEEFRARHG